MSHFFATSRGPHMKTLLWILLAVLCLSIGAHPLMYLVADGRIGLLQTKSDVLFSNRLWVPNLLVPRLIVSRIR